MLYLEDYLELIEHLPQELRDRFTDIRERDLQVHNSTQQLKDKVKKFFAEAKKLKPEQRQCEHEKLLEDYQETMKYADDKVLIATQMHEIMIKLVQRLETELEKFKLELEADHAGITEELEKRSLELDADARLDELANNHNNSTCKTPSLIKDRRRSEHKHRHHPYQNNHDNGYHARAKLTNHEYSSSKNLHHNGTYDHRRQDGKLSQNNSRPQSISPTQLTDGEAAFSAPASINGDGNGAERGHYVNNLSSFGNSSGFRYSNKNGSQNITSTPALKQQHAALSVALSSVNPQLNSSSALSMTNMSDKVKISKNLKRIDLIDPDSPLGRQNPIAAAASQAIAATQQLQQGRRTPSLKASFAAVNAGGLAPTDSFGTINRDALTPVAHDREHFRYGQFGDLGGNSSSNPLYISVTKSGRPSKRPKHRASHLYPDESPTSISSDNSVFENSESLSSADFIENGTNFGSTSPSSLDFATNPNQANTTLYQRDETKYCICRHVSYGQMIACDNQECEIEWFHYDCVGVTQEPIGKWFCPDCTRKMNGHHQQHLSQPHTQKKRGRREKLFNLVNNSIDSVHSKDRNPEKAKSLV